MDPLSTALTTLGKEAGEVAIKQAQSFLSKALGESGEAVGSWFATTMRARMYMNLIKIVAEANRRCKEAGLKPGTIPLKIIHPLLENAALEEETDLQDMWANLLANAADSESNNSVRPLYITILKELTPGEARFLNALYELLFAKNSRNDLSLKEQLRLALSPGSFSRGFDWNDLESAAVTAQLVQPRSAEQTFDPERESSKSTMLHHSIDVLIRHGLLEYRSDVLPIEVTEHGSFADVQTDDYYNLTSLASNFIQACHAPERRAESDM